MIKHIIKIILTWFGKIKPAKAEPEKIRVLTPYYEEEYIFWLSGECYCHDNPPCSHCMSEGHPNALLANENECFQYVDKEIAEAEGFTTYEEIWNKAI